MSWLFQQLVQSARPVFNFQYGKAFDKTGKKIVELKGAEPSANYPHYLVTLPQFSLKSNKKHPGLAYAEIQKKFLMRLDELARSITLDLTDSDKDPFSSVVYVLAVKTPMGCARHNPYETILSLAAFPVDEVLFPGNGLLIGDMDFTAKHLNCLVYPGLVLVQDLVD